MNRTDLADLQTVAGGATVTLIGRAAGRSAQVAGEVFMARMLGGHLFGIYALALAVVRACESIAELGLGPGGVRFVSLTKDRQPGALVPILRVAVGVPLALGVVFALLLTALAVPIADWLFAAPSLVEALRWLAWGLPVTAGFGVVATLLQGFHTTRDTVYVREVVQPVVKLGTLALLAATIGLTLGGAIAAFVLANAVGLLAGIVLYVRRARRMAAGTGDVDPVVRPLLAYSLPLVGTAFLGYLTAWVDSLALGILGTAADVGAYRAASQFPKMLPVFLGAAASIYAPVVASIHAQGDVARLGRVFCATTRWVCYLTTPAFLFLVFSAEDVMLAYGPDYVATGSSVLVVLAIGQLVNCATGNTGATLHMTGKQNVALVMAVGLLAVQIALSWVLIPVWGALGAAAASSAALVVSNVAKLLAVYRFYGVQPLSQALGRYAVVAVAAALVLAGVHDLVEGPGRMLLNGAIVTGFLGAWLVRPPRGGQEDAIFAGAVRAKLGRLLGVAG